ncbi:MAG: hypothetical protein FWH27_16085 [Planctomycetaceae bacterium]|nr:hypothetical protein [Planctomycetaceae bacterium]
MNHPATLAFCILHSALCILHSALCILHSALLRGEKSQPVSDVPAAVPAIPPGIVDNHLQAN